MTLSLLLVAAEIPEESSMYSGSDLSERISNLESNQYAIAVDHNDHILWHKIKRGIIILGLCAAMTAAKPYVNLAFAFYHNEKGNRISFYDGKYDEAEKEFKKSIDFYPSFPEPYINLGSIYFMQKRFEDAEEYYEKATELVPDSSLLCKLLAITYEYNGKNKESKLYYEMAENFSKK